MEEIDFEGYQKYQIRVDHDRMLFDPEGFGLPEMRKWIDDMGTPTTLRFYGLRSQLKRLRDRWSNFAAETGLEVHTHLDTSWRSRRRIMTVEVGR